MHIKKIRKGALARRFAAPIIAAVLLCSLGFSAAALELVPVGRTIGISMSTGGLLVSGLADVETESGKLCPAAEAGVYPGDLITAVNGNSVASAEEFIAAVSGSGSGSIELTVVRCDKELKLTVKPVDCGEGVRKLGLWLRDGISGIGTVTFYDPASGIYGALGHAVSDIDSGVIIPVGSGRVMRSQIVDIRRGESGSPGELCGCYDDGAVIGDIEKNTVSGIFGKITDSSYCTGQPIEVANDGEICTGEASIIANVAGESVNTYDIQITRIYSGDRSGRSMMIQITDPELLELTGGIVQGMSGSPIIQNGKLVGAVTHVLISDPTRGYGISIGNMLAAADDEEFAA